MSTIRSGQAAARVAAPAGRFQQVPQFSNGEVAAGVADVGPALRLSSQAG